MFFGREVQYLWNIFKHFQNNEITFIVNIKYYDIQSFIEYSDTCIFNEIIILIFCFLKIILMIFRYLLPQ